MARRKPAANSALLEKVEAFRSRHGVESNPYLAGLSSALAANKSLHTWAELDPLDHLPIPPTRSGAAQMRLVRLLTVLRNVLVFAPVALTWMAVAQATTAFSTYIQANGADVVNFLDFWQNGYDILGNEWKIGNVARLDFFIVVIVILLTLYVSRGAHQAEITRKKSEKEIDEDREALALEIHEFLFDKRKITNVTMNASLASAVSRLVAATNNLEDASKIIEKAARKLPKERLSQSSFLDSFNFDSDFKPSRKSRRG